MPPEAFYIIASLAIAIAGIIFFVLTTVKINKSKYEIEKKVLEAEKEREAILSKAKDEAQNAVKGLRRELDKEHQSAMRQLSKKENEVEKRFDLIDREKEKLNQQTKDIDVSKIEIKELKSSLKKRNVELDNLIRKEQEDLSRISKLSEDEAKKLLLEKMKNDIDAEGKTQLADRIKTFEKEAEDKAKEIICDAMQRLSHEVTAEGTTSNVELPKEELKGKIIGKEGRNIRAFEQVTGVDVIIDESPDYVVISCFDSFRRETARRTMGKLLKDGRIHPARIEEIFRETEIEIDEETRRYGEQVILEAGFNDIHPEIVRLFGRLRYRQSYGQNQIKHALQVMELCEYMAGELDLDVTLAKRCGLLHDIGKAVDQGTDGTHPALGFDLASKYDENGIVCNAIAAHHEGVEVTSIYTTITAVADAISAARPGARRESTQKYFERMEKLENIAHSFKGVNKVYAMRSGRELRIAVDAGVISDSEGILLSRDIAKSIEKEATYPGEVKVTLLRETRFVEFAR
jgi:ribonuclease Y